MRGGFTFALFGKRQHLFMEMPFGDVPFIPAELGVFGTAGEMLKRGGGGDTPAIPRHADTTGNVRTHCETGL